MANLLWGNVYYKDDFAGVLRQEPGERISFTYDARYLDTESPAIAHTLPLRPESFISQSGLPPFFDNLVAEGWLEDVQTRLIGKHRVSRFELLLAFGQDCAGAVSVVDPEPRERGIVPPDDPMAFAIMAGRASLSGIQPKLALCERDGTLHPTRTNELSTHIAKFPSPRHDDLVTNEYLATLAFKALMPDDDIVHLHIGELDGFDAPALIIKRFDRTDEGQRIHFEEFNQLLGFPSESKYDGSHKDMAGFIRQIPACLPVEVYRLYRRILAGLLLGNTDMHLKNFAMFHTASGLRLTPAYDIVAAALYGYKTIALSIDGSGNIPIGDLKAKALIRLGEEFELPKAAIKMAVDHLDKQREAAKDAVAESKTGTINFRNQKIKLST